MSIPIYRSKAGTAIDVMEEMKRTPITPGAIESHLDELLDGAAQRRTPAYIKEPMGFDGAEISLAREHEKVIAHLKSRDEAKPFKMPRGIQGGVPTGKIDEVIQDLADYFTTARFDPFRKHFAEKKHEALEALRKQITQIQSGEDV